MDEGLETDTRWLTEVDAGSTVTLRPGDRLSVRLGGNPATGYSWALTAVDRRVLEPAGEPAFREASPAVGSGGAFAFEFRAVAAGQTSLRLVYRRPWEKRRRPAQTFTVSVSVLPEGS